MKAPTSGSHHIRRNLLPSSSLLFLPLLILVAILYWQDLICIFSHPYPHQLPQHPRPILLKGKDNPEAAVVGAGGGCNIFQGKWVWDEAAHPLYSESDCPYIQPQLTCQDHGRPDKAYQHWRWQPHGCSLPRIFGGFNATFVWEMLRGKRLMFAGDSLNRGQFVSMVCLLHSVIPENAKSMKSLDSLAIFKAEEFNASIEFYWAPFLLESNADNAVIHRVTDRIVRAGSINKHGRSWKGVDILDINSWARGRRGSFKDEAKNITEMETDDAYGMALKSLVKWVHKNVDPHKTRVFFASMSPSHFKSKEWGGDEDGNCYNQTTPIDDPAYWGSESSKSMMRVVSKVLSKTKVPITFLNITQLSEYRKDAHTSIYKKQWNPLTPEQLAKPTSYADCIHWWKVVFCEEKGLEKQIP
ncbi:hypothetical protein ACLOJK_021621 [Asimina triloba]